MSSRMRRIGAARLPYLVVAGVLLLGCAQESTAPQEVLIRIAPVDFHFDDGYIAVFFDSTLVDVWAGGQVVGNGDVLVANRAPTAVSATFHDAEGNLVNGLDRYELTMTPLNATLLKFRRRDAFAGTLTRLASGTTSVEVALYNVETLTFDFGPFPVPVTVE